jgi:hypothetical protein
MPTSDAQHKIDAINAALALLREKIPPSRRTHAEETAAMEEFADAILANASPGYLRDGALQTLAVASIETVRDNGPWSERVDIAVALAIKSLE